MTGITFAAIDIGSYHVVMEIFEISPKQGLNSIDYLEKRIDLGRNTYAEGKVSNELVKELCEILKDFKRVMKTYQVKGYRACATSAIREAENARIVLGRIYQATGISVEILNNSEQRFLGYKSVACTENDFPNIITRGTAVLDLGGGSIQVSLFDKDMLITTQNLQIGYLRLRGHLAHLENSVTRSDVLVEEYIQNEVATFKKVHLKDRKIENVIVIGNNLPDILADHAGRQKVIKKDKYMELYHKIVENSPMELAREWKLSKEKASLLLPIVVVCRKFIEEFGADTIWIPGTKLTHGIAYDYAERMNWIKSSHNFENDIMMAARTIGKRYGVSNAHVQNVREIALALYDGTKKIHGLGSRERLLLECAVYLHGCGKFVSLSNVADCNYQIIMATEIIGISHLEQEMIAQIVRGLTVSLESYETLTRTSDITIVEYMTITKLIAILRIANAMDLSHMQKVQEIRATVRDDRLMINVTTNRDYTLEQGLLEERMEFFENVFGIRPVLKVKHLT